MLLNAITHQMDTWLNHTHRACESRKLSRILNFLRSQRSRICYRVKMTGPVFGLPAIA
jgi:hypothetical protein